MRRYRGFLSDAGTPYRKVFPISCLCRTSSEQGPFEVPATKEGENFLHGFDTALRALTLDTFAPQITIYRYPTETGQPLRPPHKSLNVCALRHLDYRPICALFEIRLISLRLPKATLLPSGPTSQNLATPDTAKKSIGQTFTAMHLSGQPARHSLRSVSCPVAYPLNCTAASLYALPAVASLPLPAVAL